LVRLRPDAFLPDLAASLNNLSVRLADLGRREDGPSAIEEAVEVYRELATKWPDAHKDGLYQSVAVRAWLGSLGAGPDALPEASSSTTATSRTTPAS
jgi:hypothetical protein